MPAGNESNYYEGWVEVNVNNILLCGIEQAYRLENFDGEWFGPFEMKFAGEK